MISIEITYNSKDTFELTQFICKKLYKSNIIAVRVVQTIFSLIMMYMSVLYVKNKMIFSFILIILLLLYILVWNIFLIRNYFYSKKYSAAHQSIQITFEQEKFILKSNSKEKYYCLQYNYCKIKEIHDEKNNLFIMLNNPVEFILIPKRELGVRDYDKLIDYLTSKIDNDLIYTM
ncbi:hypothetical protein J2Z44_002926 [Clostridium punense]|uniref:YcxB-like protein domain-containing protein n=1 Tax=Clostridium punense TaxID=1054297 RepID=A0ABS4K5N8_9CLOT|nr:hypothetical protein [Clostridium punense]MBP2023092.1 hypothetical protein [Clostridium punense]